jgi:hypothetical protein
MRPENKFPSHCFPPIAQKVIDGLEPIVGSHKAYGGLALIYAGSLIASEVEIQVKAGYKISTNVYAGLIGNKGESKSPAIKFMIGPLLKFFGERTKDYLDDMKKWEAKVNRVKAGRAKDRNDQLAELENNKPKMPWFGIVTDATVEGLRRVAGENHDAKHPSRIGRYNDELDGWLKSMNQYKGEGGDMAFYLQAYDGDIHIKANKGEQTACPPLTLSLIGSIQPAIFAQSFDGNNTHNGLLDRIMVAGLMEKNENFNPFAEWESNVLSEYSNWSLRLLKNRPKKVFIFPEHLQPKAREFYEWIKKVDKASGAGAAPKWWQHYFKVVAILTVLWEKDEIDEQICDHAQELCKFFIKCWIRSFKEMNKTDSEEIEEKIICLLNKAGGEMTSSEIKKKFNVKLRKAVDDVLDGMCESDVIKMIEGKTPKGRSTTCIRLTDLTREVIT